MVARRLHSWAETIPGKLLAEIELMLDRGATYDRIRQRLAAAGHDVGKSSIGRWAQQRRSEREQEVDPAVLLGNAIVGWLVDAGVRVQVRR